MFLSKVYSGLHKYELNEETFKLGAVAGTLDPRGEYIKEISGDKYDLVSGGSTVVEVVSFSGANAKEKKEIMEEKIKADLEWGLARSYCFLLGDLLNVLLDCLYKEGSYKHREYVKNMHMNTIVSTIQLPNPDPSNMDPIIVNPVQIPIELGFFMEWFYESFQRKGIARYAVGPFIRDLLQRLVNDVLYDVCYSFLLPDESPPQLVSSIFIDSSNNKYDKPGSPGFFMTNSGESDVEHWFDPLDPFGDGTGSRQILMIGDREVLPGVTKAYNCIYQRYPATFRNLSGGRDPLRDSNYVPTLYYGRGVPTNYLKDVSFKKTDMPYMRESKLFSGNFGLIALLANVYDISFTIKDHHANTYFKSGMIFNFVLTDFTNIANDFKPGDEKGTESDAHVLGTLANTLGLGGYYIVTKAEYIRKEIEEDWSIKVNAKFYGNDAPQALGRTGNSEDRPLTDKKACVDTYNKSAFRIIELSTQTEQATRIVSLAKEKK
jgi:hypothetical protein